VEVILPANDTTGTELRMGIDGSTPMLWTPLSPQNDDDNDQDSREEYRP